MRSGNPVFWAAGLFLAAALLIPLNARAGINVNIGINLSPPAYVIHEPPPVDVIPGSYVYFVPGIGVDILFYHGYWYRPYEGRWYRGRGYNGPWYHVAAHRVPSVVLHLPPDYRHARHAYRSIPYERMRRNWRRWEKERYWDRREAGRNGGHGGDDNGYGRGEHGGHHRNGR